MDNTRSGYKLRIKIIPYYERWRDICAKNSINKIVNLLAIEPQVKFRNIGIRPGEKIHELMCPSDSSFNTIEFKNFL